MAGLGLGARLTAALGSGTAPAAAVTWDAANKGHNTTLSNGDLTAATTQFANYANVRSTTAHNSGLHCFKAAVVYPSAASSQECVVGLCTASFDTTDGAQSPLLSDQAWTLVMDGNKSHDSTNTDISLPIASGAALYVYYNATSGEVGFAAAPGDAPTVAFTVAPGTSLYMVGSMYSNAEPALVSITIDPTYSGQGHNAWQ